ncbi:MAG: divalent-cation tolerance protein CutA [Armatimonadota bacterium]|nr:divalent-cation tolerance protein CutA [Armatimonadota bacterium]MDR7543139.1 divalent-cation tolerance protein CutA [Armatimonadota bacterium]
MPVVVLVTAGRAEEAERLAQALVVEHLAACVNVVPGVQSVYRWQGEVERATEWLLVIKTVQPALPAVIERIKSLHSYTVPEVLALPVSAGSDAYLAWLTGQVRPQPDPTRPSGA